MYKKPFLSRFEFVVYDLQIKADHTIITRAIESSDDDEYHLDSTIITEANEASDPDEYIIGSTSRKKSIGDDDEYFGFGTVFTKAIEDSDPDHLFIEESIYVCKTQL